MSHHRHGNAPADPHLNEKMEKIAKRDMRVEHFLRRILHFIERVIATITIIVLIVCLGLELLQMWNAGLLNADLNQYLHNVLTIVVGLEFVRMLLDMTPANTLEVLIVAIARQVILTHDNPWSNVASVLCIAGLFAIRRFLIPKNEMTIELSEVEEDVTEDPTETHVEQAESVSSR